MKLLRSESLKLPRGGVVRARIYSALQGVVYNTMSNVNARVSRLRKSSDIDFQCVLYTSGRRNPADRNHYSGRNPPSPPDIILKKLSYKQLKKKNSHRFVRDYDTF